jgi:hypothetical protein
MFTTKIKSSIFFIMLTLLAASVNAAPKKHNVKPVVGYVPNSESAITIAIAVWRPIYGRENIANQAPFTAVLNGNTWFVSGSLPKATVGGVAIMEIDKISGKIIRVSHGK